MPRRALIATVMLTALLVLSAPAGRAEEPNLDEIVRNPVIGNYKGYAEFKMANYATARMIWEALAERGNAEANFNLGILYEDGLGVPKDMARALQYFERSAESGNQRAQYRLGLLYSAGGTVPLDPARSRKWLGAAAAQGDADAAKLLAMRERAGADPRDDAYYRAEVLHVLGRNQEAAAIWKDLADAGDTRSRTRLAWLYEAGQGVPRDLDQAARLFRRSAEEGDPEAQYALAVMLQTGKGQQQNAAQAREWLKRAARQGHAAATAALAAPSAK